MTTPMLFALLVGAAAVVEDLRYRTISNWTTLGAAGAGLVYHTWQTGWTGFVASFSGLAIGFLSFFVFYLLGGMGAGDIKLMAAFGAILGGVTLPVQAAIFAAAIGGLMAVGALAVHFFQRQFSSGEWKPALSRSIPYAPAITSGAWLTLFGNS